jgi:hypothetical protein
VRVVVVSADTVELSSDLDSDRVTMAVGVNIDVSDTVRVEVCGADVVSDVVVVGLPEGVFAIDRVIVAVFVIVMEVEARTEFEGVKEHVRAVLSDLV